MYDLFHGQIMHVLCIVFVAVAETQRTRKATTNSGAFIQHLIGAVEAFILLLGLKIYVLVHMFERLASSNYTILCYSAKVCSPHPHLEWS